MTKPTKPETMAASESQQQAQQQISPEVQARIKAREAHNQRLRDEARKNRAAKGVQVEAGMTWQDLTPEQRATHFANHENSWKNRYNSRQQKNKAQAHQTFSVADPVNFKM